MHASRASVRYPVYALHGKRIALKPARTAGWMSARATSAPLLFATNDANSVYVYDASDLSNPPPIGEIAIGVSGPGGLAADTKGTLYVPNIGNDTVTVYPRGHIAPSLTLSQGLSYPSNATVSAKGDVAVANEGPENTTVVEFARKSATPERTITCTKYPIGLAYDAAGNLFIGDVTTYPTQSTIYEVAPGSTTCVDTGITAIAFAGGMAFDRKGNLWIAEQNGPSGNGVHVFPPGSAVPLPFAITNIGDPVSVAFDRAKNLYISDFIFGEIFGFPYMVDNPFAQWYNGLDFVVGLAVAPAPKP